MAAGGVLRSVSSLFQRFIIVNAALKKIPSANAVIRTSKGTRKMRKARKYRRPEDLEDKNYYGIGPHKKIESATNSLSARGFPKERKSYKPPSDVLDQVQLLCKRLSLDQMRDTWQETSLSDSLLKYKLLTECIKAFNHDIPNPVLCKLKTVGDVINYYSTPVDGILPYDALVQQSDKLPPNLHIIPDYQDFDPDTDTFFDGQTAFPGRPKIIFTKTGQKLEKKVEWPKI